MPPTYTLCMHLRCILYCIFYLQVLFTHRIAWSRGSPEGNCDANTVAAATLIGGGELACRSGCSGSIGFLQYQCTDFSVSEDWSAGQGSNEVSLSGVTSFEAS